MVGRSTAISMSRSVGSVMVVLAVESVGAIGCDGGTGAGRHHQRLELLTLTAIEVELADALLCLGLRFPVGVLVEREFQVAALEVFLRIGVATQPVEHFAQSALRASHAPRWRIAALPA